MKNHPEQVRRHFKQHQGRMCISSVTFGELMCGAECSPQPEHHIGNVEAMAARLEVLPFDSRAASHFGQVRAELRRAGQPIGPYDMMIAGHARSLGLMLVTNNLKEFIQVQGLRLEHWTA